MSCLQRFVKIFKTVFFSIYSYTVIYALFGVLSLSYHACFNSSLSTLEKRYRFSSSTGSYIMITDNVATVLTNIFIGYYGKTAHKPRWMSIGCLITGLSVMITALPYFIYGPSKESELEYVANRTLSKLVRSTDQMCFKDEQEEDCRYISANSTMTMVAVICFGVSNFFRGFGTSIYFTYGTPYLDDNVSKAKMPTLFAFIFAARIFGAPIGFYLSSLALKVYEDPFSTPPGLVNTDPRWIGAWWIGFLVSGALMLLLAIPLSFFPREFKKTKKQLAKMAAAEEAIQLVQTTREQQQVAVENGQSSSQNENSVGMEAKSPDLILASNNAYADPIKRQQQGDSDKSKSSNQEEQKLSLKKIPGEVYQIIKNPIVLCQMTGNLFRGIGMIGYFVYQTRYLESQFRQSASKASLVSGTTGFMAKISGVLFGGLLITLLRPGPRVLTIYIFIVELTSVFTLLYGASVLGPQYIYPDTYRTPDGQLALDNTCNSACHCDYVSYQPVCNHDNTEAYFSPCHAGCQFSFKLADNSSTHFTGCNCVSSKETVKSLKRCPPDSDNLMKYAYIVAIGGMVSGSSRSGNMVTFFRSITPEQKSLAVAIGSFWHSLFVSIPYPLIYGRIFDNCCIVWNSECGERGNCWLYDTEKLRVIYHTVSIVLIAIGSFFDLVMIFLSPRLGKLYDDDEGKRTIRDKICSFFCWWKRSKVDSGEADISVQQQLSTAVTDQSATLNSTTTKTGLKVTEF